MTHPAKWISVGLLFCLLFYFSADAQPGSPQFTHADTLRGSMNAERNYDVLKYDITITPDFETRSIQGSNTITYLSSGLKTIQIDLQEPLIIDSILRPSGKKLDFSREGNAFHVSIQQTSSLSESVQQKLTVYYHGNPQIAAKPPWDGGFIFTRDSLGRPWMTVACEGTGASIWYPCKDYLGDEPDSGARVTMIVPDSLVAIANGRLINKFIAGKGLMAWTWGVSNPINNYNIIPYIGKYVNWHKTFYGQKGNLDCSYWVLDYDRKKAMKHFSVVDSMLSCFELWFGPYPFYEDGYKLVQTPHLGMEHQSAIAYGNHFLQGYLGRDLSGTGWGLKWDFIIVHESGHEWFGNNISCKDIADEWIHESFTNYSETIYTGQYFGKSAGDDYCIGTRSEIENKHPIIEFYGVNREPFDTDEYYKGGNMIHTIRQVIHNEETFRKILRGLNQHFYHQTVTADEFLNYFSKLAGMDLTPVFNQYLRSTAIPELEYRFEGKYLNYRWANCNPDFNMPVLVDVNGALWLKPTNVWKKLRIPNLNKPELQIDRNFYVTGKKTE